MDQNKFKKDVYSVIVIVALLIFSIGGAYAYFMATGGSEAEKDIMVTTKTNDSLMFMIEDPGVKGLNIEAGPENFASGKGNQEDLVTARATLKTSNEKNHVAKEEYNLYLNITENTLEYSLD